MTDTIVQISSQLTAPKKKNNKKKTYQWVKNNSSEWGFGAFIAILWGKEKQSKTKKKKKKFGLPLKGYALCS